jgi:DNA-binding NtrC family response regulator
MKMNDRGWHNERSEKPRSPRILIVDDEEKIRLILCAILAGEGYDIESASDGIEALEKGEVFRPDILIVDLQMPRMDGIETLVRFKERFPRAVAIILTAHGSIQSAVQAIRQGAYDYLTKPFDNDQLLIVVRRAVDLVHLSGELERLREKLEPQTGLHAIVGEGGLMRETREQILKLAANDATVLIQGESGTGKELAARAIHSESKRNGKPLVIVDCAAIPDLLVESSFFGHEKGAFTDAHEQTAGAFEEADGGCVFLDEIGELPMGAQAKLLRVLQEKEFTRIGSPKPIRVDVRVIAATNKDLEARVREGKFREDLFYRLNVLRLRMPPLREHIDDLPLYAGHFIRKYREVFGTRVSGVSASALNMLSSRPWKGNIRELENSLQRAMLIASGDTLQEADFGFPADGAGRPGRWDPALGLESYIRTLSEQTEREIILETLNRNGWNRTEAAQQLKISRKTLFNKMLLFGLERERNK